MFLTASNLIHYLRLRGLLTSEEIVDKRVTVRDAGRRNRNFKVLVGERDGLFVKQVGSHSPEAFETVSREARLYDLAASGDLPNGLRTLMPEFVQYDTRQGVLVVRLVTGGRGLNEYHHYENDFPADIGRLLGEAVGAYQSDMAVSSNASAWSGLFRHAKPWILSIYKSQPSAGQVSAGNVKLIEIIKKYPDFQVHLERLENDWRHDCLTHGDMKWDNVLVFPEDGDRTGFRIVDWELADIGDAAWDVGALFQAYLQFWILSMPLGPNTDPEYFVANAAFPIEKMQPSIQSFWDAYAHSRGLEDASQTSFLRRSIEYGAARMVQTAFEFLQQSPELNNQAVAMLQLSLNILKNPDDAAAAIFNISNEETVAPTT